MKQMELTNQQLVAIVKSLQEFKEQGGNIYLGGVEMLKIVKNTKALSAALEPYNEVCSLLLQKYNLNGDSENRQEQEQMFLKEIAPVLAEKVTVEINPLDAETFSNHQLNYASAEALAFMIE